MGVARPPGEARSAFGPCGPQGWAAGHIERPLCFRLRWAGSLFPASSIFTFHLLCSHTGPLPLGRTATGRLPPPPQLKGRWSLSVAGWGKQSATEDITGQAVSTALISSRNPFPSLHYGLLEWDFPWGLSSPPPPSPLPSPGIALLLLLPHLSAFLAYFPLHPLPLGQAGRPWSRLGLSAILALQMLNAVVL